MIKVVLKVLLLLLVIKISYKHRYKLMNMMLSNPFIRQYVVNNKRNPSSGPIGLITRVYL